MATLTGTQAKSATLSTTTVDTISMTGYGELLTIINRDAAAGTAFWCTYGQSAAGTPTAAGDDCYPVPPGYGSISFRIPETTNAMVVKILGNSHPYTVMISATPGT